MISLSDHFTYRKLLRFTFPSIAMMLFTSIYGIVDGFFVSNFVGKEGFAAVNFIFPFLMMLGAIGFMFGTGGAALISMLMGEGNDERANRVFSLLIVVTIVLGAVIGIAGQIFLPAITRLLGAEGKMLEGAVLYGRIYLLSLPAFMLQMEFQTFFVAAERPNLGFAFTVAAGVMNIVLDALLVGVFRFGIAGAAAATAGSQALGGIAPLFYFFFNKTSRLHLCRPKFDTGALVRTVTNGFSELLSNISMSLVGLLYNVQLMKYAGENGVAAYGVLMYVNMIFIAVFIGYAVGTAPIVGFHYGAQNREELRSVLRKSAVVIGISSVLMCLFAEFAGGAFATLYVGYDAELLELTKEGFRYYAFSFLFTGFCIFISSFFTALNNGLISAVTSFFRTMICQTVSVFIFPVFFGVTGVWISVVLAEILAFIVYFTFLLAYRKRYGYM